jgi:DNA-binding response OmpR family regulator
MAHVVLAEDDRQLLAFFGTVLERAGHTVLRCSTGDAALNAVHAVGADIVVTDLAMSPGLDGWAVINRIKSDPSTARIPIMVVTVRDDLAPNLPGVVSVLTKPVSPAELVKNVRTALASANHDEPQEG